MRPKKPKKNREVGSKFCSHFESFVHTVSEDSTSHASSVRQKQRLEKFSSLLPDHSWYRKRKFVLSNCQSFFFRTKGQRSTIV